MPHSTWPWPVETPPRKTPEERLQARQNLRALYALPIYRLPTELIVNILNILSLADFPPLVTAAWHLLRFRGIAPAILTPRLTDILVEARPGFYGSVENATDASNQEYLPPELRRLILNRLAPRPPFFSYFTSIGERLRGGFEFLPTEIRDSIFRLLDPATSINVTLACYRFSNRDIEWLTHKHV